MRKHISVVFILIFAVFFSADLFAKEISKTGYGDTVQEAKQAALNELTAYFFGAFVQSSTRTGLFDNGDRNKGFYASVTSVRNFGNLLYVDYHIGISGENEKSFGKYKAEAYISEEMVDNYKSEMVRLKSEIEANYKLLGQNGKDTYLLGTLYDSLVKFEDYSRVVSGFTGTDDYPKLENDLNSKAVLIDYESALIDEENRLRDDQQRAYTSAELEDIRIKLAKNAEIQKELAESKKDKEREIAETSRRNLELRLAGITPQFSKYEKKKSSNVLAMKDLNERIDSIQATAMQYVSATGRYQQLIDEEKKRIESEIRSETASIRKMSFRITELSYGRPTDEAYQYRQSMIDNVRREKNAELANSLEMIEETGKKDLQPLYDKYMDMLDDLQASKYRLSNRDGGFGVSVNYNAIDRGWTFKVREKAYSDDYKNLRPNFTFNLTYKDLTGKNPVSRTAGNEAEFEEFTQDVEYLQTLFDNFDSNFVLDIVFSIDIDMLAGNAGIFVNYENASFYSAGGEVLKEVGLAIPPNKFASMEIQGTVFDWIKPKKSYNSFNENNPAPDDVSAYSADGGSYAGGKKAVNFGFALSMNFSAGISLGRKEKESIFNLNVRPALKLEFAEILFYRLGLGLGFLSPKADYLTTLEKKSSFALTLSNELGLSVNFGTYKMVDLGLRFENSLVTLEKYYSLVGFVRGNLLGESFGRHNILLEVCIGWSSYAGVNGLNLGFGLEWMFH